jgi:hypothetical protein
MIRTGAAILCATVFPAHSQGTLDADTLKQYGGTYSSDCRNPAAPRGTVFADALVVLEGDKRTAGGNVQAAYSYFGQSPPPYYEVALLSEVRGSGQLMFIVYRDKSGQYMKLDGDAKVLAALGKALSTHKYRHCDPSRKVTAVPPAGAPQSASAGDAGLLLLDPKFKSAYYKALGPRVKESWLTKFDGPSPETRKVKVAGREYVLAGSCKNHDCADNNVVLLYSAADGAVYGKIFARGKSILIGSPPPAVAAELERLWVSEWRRK